MNIKSKTIFSFLIITLNGIIMGSTFIAESNENGSKIGSEIILDNKSVLKSRMNYISHSPIKIDGNVDLNVENGVGSGSGIESDPFIIENWIIDGNDGYGIFLRNTTSHIVIRNCLVFNSGGFDIEGYRYWDDMEYNAGGIQFFNVHNVLVENNSVSKNKGRGIGIINSNNNTIKNNNCSDYGIRIENSNDNMIESNNCSNATAGIELWGSNNNVIIENNNNFNSYSGIFLRSSDDNTLVHNTIQNNRNGIELMGSINNTFKQNDFIKNNQNGMNIFNSFYNQIIDNLFNSNKYHAMNFHSSDLNVVSENILNYNNLGGIRNYNSVSNKYIDNYFNNNSLYIGNSKFITLKNNSFINSGLEITGQGSENWSSHDIDNSNRVNQKPIYYWINKTSGIIPDNAGQIILVNCSNIKIEGHNITKTDIGITLGFSENCFVENNTINLNNYIGITLYHSNNNDIKNNDFLENGDLPSGYGIKLVESSNNTVTMNECSSNGYYGIYLSRSSNNFIVSNLAENNYFGIDLNYLSENNSISNNNISKNTFGIMIDRSVLNIISENVYYLNKADGIALFDSSYNLINNNIIEHNEDGIWLLRSNNNYLNNNIVSRNGYYSQGKGIGDGVGIKLETSSLNNIESNECSFNTDCGIWLWKSSIENNLFNNSCNVNEVSGIKITVDSSDNFISNNTCTSNNNSGIAVQTSMGNVIINNSCNFNNGWGTGVSFESHYSVIYNNECNNNTYDGIKSSDSDDVEIGLNTCNNNLITGIKLKSSNNNLVNHNTIEVNIIHGIYLLDSNYNSIVGNLILNNGLGIFLNLSNNNFVYHNNIIDNKNQAFDEETNDWENTGEGNYWSDYTGEDNGANGRVIGDGIGDTEIPHMGLDNYPLMEPYVDLDNLNNMIITIKLSKNIYQLSEPITGTLEIHNNNSINIILKDNLMAQSPPGDHFRVKSFDNSETFNGINEYSLYPITIKANETIIIEFTIIYCTQILQDGAEFTIGNYSIYAFFYFGSTREYNFIYSNIENFTIVVDETSLFNKNPEPLDPNKSSKGFFINSITAFAVLIIIVTALFITNTEVGKYGFFSAIAPLYSKQRKKKDVKSGYNKGLVMGYIMGNPGERYNDIKNVLELPNGTLSYYLKMLEKEEIIRSEKDGFNKRFYPKRGKITKDVLELTDVQRDIFQFIEEHQGTLQKEIKEYLGIKQQKLNYHIQLMVKARIIRLEREGKRTKCYVIEDNIN